MSKNLYQYFVNTRIFILSVLNYAMNNECFQIFILKCCWIKRYVTNKSLKNSNKRPMYNELPGVEGH